MELVAGLGALGGSLGTVATMAQLVGNANGLISMIGTAAETVRRNRVESKYLATRVSTIGQVLPHLPRGGEVARPLSDLNKTLREAHSLVVACQKRRGTVNLLLGASGRAERFREANARINSDINVVNLSLHGYIANGQRRKYVGGLISMISQAAETARQNKVECELLANRMSTIAAALSRLPPEPDQSVVRPLADLHITLQEAHGLVVACQKRSAVNLLFRVGRRADMFRDVNARINTDIGVLNLSLHVAQINRRKFFL